MAGTRHEGRIMADCHTNIALARHIERPRAGLMGREMKHFLILRQRVAFATTGHGPPSE